jgi:transcriptional regulator with XRE-family HTH domain
LEVQEQLAARHIALRERAGLTQEQEAKMAGVSPTTISGIESGKIARPHLKTLLKLARALGADIGELRESAKVQAPSSQEKLFNNGVLEEERRASWEAAVDNARELRESGRAHMEELIAAWQASKNGGEAYDARSGYLAAMGTLLQQAYDAETSLLEPVYGTNLAAEQFPERFHEVQKADRFYIELWRLVQEAGLSIRTNGEQADEPVQSEKRAETHNVEEPIAA